MESPKSLHQSKGFTLTEIVIAVALLMVIFGLGFFVSWDFYRSYAKNSETSVLVSVLQKARSHSVNNINQVRHGVHFAEPLQYIIFECDSGTPQCISYDDANYSQDLVINPAYGITISNAPLPDVVFEQLSGAAISDATIEISDGSTITVNTQGQISW